MLLAGIAFPVAAQQRPLNPVVVVREHPTSAVPPECEQGLAPAVPRAPQPSPEPAPLPETSAQIANQDVAQALREVQAAAETNDHERFVAALAVARAAADAAPPGGQRDVANDALKVESDIDRLWSFSLDSPTGAFFDASSEGGTLLTMLRQYPDFGKTVADSTLLVGDQTLYPTRESRQFLIRQAATRLVRLGIHTVARTPLPPRRQPMSERPSVPVPSPKAVEAAAAKESGGNTSTARSTSRTAPRTSVSGSTPAPRRHTTSTAPAVHAAAPSTRPATSATHRTTVSPVVKAPAPQPTRVAPKSSAVVSPAVHAPVVSATHAASTSALPAIAATPRPTSSIPPAKTPPPVTTAVTTSSATRSMIPSAVPLTATATATTTTVTATSTTSTIPTASTAGGGSASIPSSVPASTSGTEVAASSDSASTATSGTAAAPHPAEEGSGQMNLMFAIILILAGVGLLWFFIRSSE